MGVTLIWGIYNLSDPDLGDHDLVLTSIPELSLRDATARISSRCGFCILIDQVGVETELRQGQR